MAQTQSATISTFDLEKALRATDPAVVLAPPRLLRRVIRLHRGINLFLRKAPHRKTYVIDTKALLQYVDPDELDLPDGHQFAEQTILIQRPRPEKVATVPRGQLLLEFWRLLYHARIDAHLAQRVAEGSLTPAMAVERIHAIGQTAFDEIRAVLSKERFLLPPTDNLHVYSEFCAVFSELRRFLPGAAEIYFPSIDSPDRIDAIIGQDVDAQAILESTRLDGADEPGSPSPVRVMKETGAPSAQPAVKVDDSDAAYQRQKLTQRAEKASAVGNFAGAATYRVRAAYLHPPETRHEHFDSVRKEIRQLAGRLQKVFGFDNVQEWTEAMSPLLDAQTVGWRTPGARILWDLQAVCIDHEKEIFKLSLVEWALSRGAVPIRRPMPLRRIVRLHQHLNAAIRRLQKAPFDTATRDRLLALLQPRLHEQEHRIRETLRPKIEAVFDESDFKAASVAEELARKKLIEELLDRVADRGFITMGDLRDAISRNQLKLPDISAETFFGGDALLKIDKKMWRVLDGVYKRGEVYKRWPQRMSSLAFGTKVGRAITLYAAIPYLGAFILLEAMQHIVHLFVGGGGHETPVAPPGTETAPAAVPVIEPAVQTVAPDGGVHLNSWLSIFITGTILLWLMHAPKLRAALFNVIRWSFRRFKGIVIEWPGELLNLPWVKRIFSNRPLRLIYRYLLKPAFFGVLIWILFHEWGVDKWFSLGSAIIFFLVMNGLYNTRIGRSLEEQGGDLILRGLRRFGWRMLVGLAQLIIDFFKRVADAFEQLVYNIDEFMRFRSGESRIVTVFKLVFGTVWFLISYAVMFMVTLFIEPQINPIKHFPVVTVSHKVLLGMVPVFAEWVAPLVGGDLKQAYYIVGSVVWLIPGIFGYLAWELKENWRLYAANRATNVKPIIVGSHGETMLRLLRPGFHSGTVPKLYGKLRRIERQRPWRDSEKARRKHLHALHHVEESVQRFIERDLVALLAQSRAWKGESPKVEHVHLGGNSIRFDLACPSLGEEPVRFLMEEQSGWMVASIVQPGWLTKLDEAQLDTFKASLSGFYKMSAVDLVREQIEATIDVNRRPYDVDDRGIVVWPADSAEPKVMYPLLREAPENGDIPEAVRSGQAHPEPGMPLPLFRHQPIAWCRWVDVWQKDRDGGERPVQLVQGPSLVVLHRDTLAAR
ncbi:MAG: hypothetical protein WD768_13840 [Phycisphaeraceae bacterium]